MGLGVAARYLIRPLSNRARYASDIARTHTVWKSGLECGDAGNLPAANGQVGCPAHVRRNLLAASNGQVVNEARNEPLVDVEIRRSVIEIRIVVVHEALEATAAGAHAGRRRFVIFAVSPGIDGGYGHVACTTFELHVHRVVVGVAVEVAVDVEVGEVLVRQPR